MLKLEFLTHAYYKGTVIQRIYVKYCFFFPFFFTANYTVMSVKTFLLNDFAHLQCKINHFNCFIVKFLFQIVTAFKQCKP